MSRYARYLLIPAVLLYGASLFVPAFYCASPVPGPLVSQGVGLHVLLMGWAGMANLEFRWFANLPFFAAVWMHLAAGTRARAHWRGLGVGLLGCAAWTYLTPVQGCQYGQHLYPVAAFGIGAHLWVSALVLAGLSCLTSEPLRKREK